MCMPRKIRELIGDLEAAGFVRHPGKGSHRKFFHDRVAEPVVVSGNLGDDVRPYQEKNVRRAIEESKR